MNGQIGLEANPAEYIDRLVDVFREVRRVLRPNGTLWLNIGDSYCTHSVRRADGKRSVMKSIKGIGDLPKWAEYAANGDVRAAGALRQYGYKAKDLMMIPARVAIALQDDGWYLRSDIIWSKSSCMPESVADRPTNS